MKFFCYILCFCLFFINVICNTNISTNATYPSVVNNKNYTNPKTIDSKAVWGSPKFNTNFAGFYIVLLLGLVIIVLISLKAYRLRFSRAERRYGVQGERGTQELVPLPLAIEDDDSENDDQTLFDIHQPRYHNPDHLVL